MQTTYNGWTNWETWRAALWIVSEQENYRLAVRIMNSFYHFEDIKNAFKASAPDFYNPDMENKDWSKVNWDEIADMAIQAAAAE